MSSSEIEQMALGWKKAVLKYKNLDTPNKTHIFKDEPEKVLKFFRAIERHSHTRVIYLKKAFQPKDIPVKIWKTVKRIRYIPMMIRSKRNERPYRRPQDN